MSINTEEVQNSNYTDEEQKLINDKEKGNGSRPTYYDAYTDSTVEITKDFEDFLGRFVKGLQTRHFAPREDNDIKARTMNSDSELAQMMFDEARTTIPRKVAEQDVKYTQGEGLTKDSAKLFKDL